MVVLPGSDYPNRGRLVVYEKYVPGVAKKGLTGLQVARRGCHEAVEVELNRKRTLRPLCPAGIRSIKTGKD